MTSWEQSMLRFCEIMKLWVKDERGNAVKQLEELIKEIKSEKSSRARGIVD